MKKIPETRGPKKRVEYKLTKSPQKFDITKRQSIAGYAARNNIKIKTAIVDGYLWVALIGQ